MMKILFVGGRFDEEGGRPSGLAGKMAAALMELGHAVHSRNGGPYIALDSLKEQAKGYDVVFWWADVPNEAPKVRNVKEVAPHVMLVTSKRNDGGRYPFGELVGRALAAKANLCFEFSKQSDGIFSIMVFDPLGTVWYRGTDFKAAMAAACERLVFLRSITRNATVQSDTDKGLVMSWYFDRFKEEMQGVNREVAVPAEERFVKLVKSYAEVFQSLMPGAQTTRFLGNASMKGVPKALGHTDHGSMYENVDHIDRSSMYESNLKTYTFPEPVPPQVGRCGKGMPSFRKDGHVFVSERNVDKQFLSLENFVPVYMEGGRIFYCGDRKPSVDTPIQLRLYDALPNIQYMIHSHCYIKGAPFTRTSMPCGAVEEVSEVLEVIDKEYGCRSLARYVVNLIGHGSIAMSMSIKGLEGLEYEARPMPEFMYGNEAACEREEHIPHDRCLELLCSVIDWVTASNNTKESLRILFGMGFQKEELVHEFAFGEEEVEEAETEYYDD